MGVAFTGNQYFSSDLLPGRLKIQPAAYASPGRYSSALLQDDVASIRTLYEANGFHEVEVQSQLTDNYQGHHGDLSVRFEIKEGQQTRVADLAIEGNKQLSHGRTARRGRFLEGAALFRIQRFLRSRQHPGPLL